MNGNLDQVRKGVREIGDMLAAKQMKANAGKSTFVILGHQRSMTYIINKIETDPVMMGDNEIAVSYLEYWINENGTSVSISETKE